MSFSCSDVFVEQLAVPGQTVSDPRAVQAPGPQPQQALERIRPVDQRRHADPVAVEAGGDSRVAY